MMMIISKRWRIMMLTRTTATAMVITMVVMITAHVELTRRI
uniref:Uncharacterized protein n=1 Tax=Octopus bimaculoides TaxID=37653 RepID=A0A0L8G8A1_OCTBM